MKIQSLWPTNIGLFEFRHPDLRGVHSGVLDHLRGLSRADNQDPASFDIWKQQNAELDLLKAFIRSSVDAYTNAIGGRQAIMNRGWINRQAPFQATTPHNHLAYLAAVYYLNTPTRSGDLLLLDPRGMPQVWPGDIDQSGDRRMYHRVQPHPGLLVVFPGYLIHEVETNLSDEDRFAIATNFSATSY